MAYGSDYLVDRRRLKRRLTFWRIATVVAVVAAIVIGPGRFGGPLGGGDFIARVEVKGVILHDDDRDPEKIVSLPRMIASKRLSFALTVPAGRSSAARPFTMRCSRSAKKNRW